MSIVTVAVASTLTLTGFWVLNGYPQRLHQTVGDILSNFLLVQNLTGAKPYPTVLWSLPLELQMYLFLPALYLLAKRIHAVGLLAIWVLSV